MDSGKRCHTMHNLEMMCGFFKQVHSSCYLFVVYKGVKCHFPFSLLLWISVLFKAMFWHALLTQGGPNDFHIAQTAGPAHFLTLSHTIDRRFALPVWSYKWCGFLGPGPHSFSIWSLAGGLRILLPDPITLSLMVRGCGGVYSATGVFTIKMEPVAYNSAVMLVYIEMVFKDLFSSFAFHSCAFMSDLWS